MGPKKHPRETASPLPPRTPASPAPSRKSFFQWVPSDEAQLEAAEQRMLAPIANCFTQRRIAGINTISALSSACGPTTITTTTTSGNASASSTNAPEPAIRMVVLVHGFGGGLGNWARNWSAISRRVKREYGTDVHAIDLPGFARSMREDVKFNSHLDVIAYYEAKFLAWLSELPEYRAGTTKVDVVGHSFGAYLMAHISCRNPELVATLVLADPWGVPPEVPDAAKSLPLRFKLLKWVFYNTTPLGILRAVGPFGPALLPKVRPDFATRWADFHDGDPYPFFDYTYLCNSTGRPTGELAFQASCTGTAFAKLPLLNHLPAMLSPTTRLVVLFGSHTWMDRDAGRELTEEASRCGITAEFHIIANAGHQVNTDNVEGFNRTLLAALFR